MTDSTAKNAYVGSDVYNLIINSNYFTGYMVLGLILVLFGSALLICSYVKELTPEEKIECIINNTKQEQDQLNKGAE